MVPFLVHFMYARWHRCSPDHKIDTPEYIFLNFGKTMLLLVVGSALAIGAKPAPNIITILTDDQGKVSLFRRELLDSLLPRHLHDERS